MRLRLIIALYVLVHLGILNAQKTADYTFLDFLETRKYNTDSWEIDTTIVSINVDWNNYLHFRTYINLDNKGRVVKIEQDRLENKNPLPIGDSWYKTLDRKIEYDKNGNKISIESYGIIDDKWGKINKIIRNYDSRNNLISDTNQDGVNDGWLNIMQEIYLYDKNDNLLNTLFQQWKNNKWEDATRISKKYDNQQNLIEDVTAYFINSQWLIQFKTIYIYDKISNLKEKIFYSSESGISKNTEKFTYTYDINNNIISESRFVTSPTSSDWIEANNISYIYNQSNQRISQELNSKVDNSWLNESMKYAYNTNGDIISMEIYKENKLDMVFNYSYDSNNNLLEDLRKTMYEELIPDRRIKYAYDDNGNCIDLEANAYDYITKTWIPWNYFVIKYTYNNGKSKASIGGDVYRGKFTYYNLNSSLSNKSIPELSQDIQIYPNPASDYFSISLNIENKNPISISLYKTSGELVKKIIRPNTELGLIKQTIPISFLETGIYIVNINTGKKTISKKLIINK